MRRRRGSDTVTTIVATLAASIGIHLVLWPVGDRVISLADNGPPIPLAGGVMEVSLVPDDEEEDGAEDEEEETDPEVKAPGKLVQLDRVLEERPPEDTEYVSEFDSRTDRETAAPNARAVPGAPQQNPGDSPDANNAVSPGPTQPSDARALSLGERTGQSAKGEGDSADSTLAPAEDGNVSNNAGAAGSSGGRPGLRGSPDAMKRTFGSAGSMDDLDGVEPGNQTILNSRRWRFASFFNRVRNQTTQHWHPEQVHRARDPEGKIYGTSTWTTRLIIRLNPDGSLSGISIDRTSGLDFLDEEAIRAIRTAQPFSNPPPQLVDTQSGLIEFRFAFIFEVGSKPRIFRYRR